MGMNIGCGCGGGCAYCGCGWCCRSLMWCTYTCCRELVSLLLSFVPGIVGGDEAIADHIWVIGMGEMLLMYAVSLIFCCRQLFVVSPAASTFFL